MRHVLLFLSLIAVISSSAVPAAAQTTDAVSNARALEKSGKRAEAIAVLRTRLAASDTDDDAREVLGVYLSWEGQYDEARTLLKIVVDRHPTDLDALAALMNVELWSGQPASARQLAERGLSIAHADQRFQTGHERAMNKLASARVWTLSAGYSHDSFSDHRQAWQETQVSLKRYTTLATVIGSVVRAERFGLKDTQYQVDLYPKFRPGSYAYVSLGVAPDQVLYPHVRVGADLYQSVGSGVELSAGFRRLQFATATTIYVGAVSKYWGDWLLTGRMYYVPDRTGQSSKSYHASARHYFGRDGTSYIGGRYSHGFSREEVISINDFEVLGSDTFAVDADIAIGARWRVSALAVSSRQDRLSNTSLRQNSISGAIGVRF